MIKKSAAVLLILLILITANACSVKKGDVNIIISSTKQVTLVKNTFKDALPNYKFKNEINDTYSDGISYKFTVKCSQSDCEKYIEKVKKSGFVINPAVGTNYYSAQTEDNYSAEITYINGIMTVLCKKAK